MPIILLFILVPFIKEHVIANTVKFVIIMVRKRVALSTGPSCIQKMSSSSKPGNGPGMHMA